MFNIHNNRFVASETPASRTLLQDLPRQLDQRESSGMLVTLYWDPVFDRVLVSVDDSVAMCGFTVEVPRDQALDALDHPYAYTRKDQIFPYEEEG